MGSLEVLVGISGSGKSSYAHERALLNKWKTVVVSRDKIREMLFSYTESDVYKYYESNLKYKESVVSDFQTNVIRHALNEDYHVIVDNTHLQLRYINSYNLFPVHISYTLFEVTVEESINRQQNRVRKVLPEIIQKQYNDLQELKTKFDFYPRLVSNLLVYNPSFNQPVYVFDIDGTLAIRRYRSPFDWSKVFDDMPNHSVCSVYRDLKESGVNLIICSGRDEVCRPATEKWLSKYNILYDKLYMRKSNDNRPDWIVKEEFWRDITQNYFIEAMFDDRNQVVDHARAVGLPCFQVAPGNF